MPPDIGKARVSSLLEIIISHRRAATIATKKPNIIYFSWISCRKLPPKSEKVFVFIPPVFSSPFFKKTWLVRVRSDTKNIRMMVFAI
jgi:hypothetical protein